MFNCMPNKPVCQEAVKIFLAGAANIEDIVYWTMEEGSFGRVGQFVVNFFAEAAGADEACLFEQAEMVWYGGRAHIDRNGDVIDAFFAMTQKEQDF